MRTVLLEKSENQQGSRVITSGEMGSDIVVGAILEFMDSYIRMVDFFESVIHRLILFPAISCVVLGME